jgi:predicted Zn-dependent peptidase
MVRIRKDGLILDIKPGNDVYLNSPDLKTYIGYDVYSLPIEDYIKYEMLKNMENVLETGLVNEHQCHVGFSDIKRHFYVRTVKNGNEEVILIIRDITEEINMYYDDPKEIPLLKLGGVLWPGQPMSSDLLGTKEIIRRLQPQDLRLYMNTYYKTENLVLSVAGGIKAEKILLGLEKTFSKVSQGKKKQPEKVIENQKERKIKVFFKDSDQAHAVLAYRTFSYSDKRKYILDVFSTLFGVGLGSILHHEIREKRGLAYYADASYLYATDCGTLIIRAGFNKDKVGEALGVVKTELNKAKRELYIQKRINRAKELIKGIFKIRLERAEGLSDWYGKRELLSPEIPEPKEIAGLIDKVTAEEIKNLANDIFKDDLENLVIVGPYKDKARFEKALKSR